MKRNGTRFALAACATMLLSPAIWGQRPFNRLTSSTLDGTPILGAGDPTASRPYLGLVLWDHKTESGEARCFVRLVRPGPVGETRSGIEEGDLVLSLNDQELHTTDEFRRVLAAMSPGAEARLRIRRTSSKPDTVRTVTTRVGSWADWAAPTDFVRPPKQRAIADDLINVGAGRTRFEQFVQGRLDKQGISQPVDKLRKYLVETVERNYGVNMLGRVAYSFYRPMRLAELQVSITDPLARIVEQHKDDPLTVSGPILTEAAKNLDVTFSPGERGRIDIANPRQALRDAAGMVRRAYSHLDKAFGKIDAAARVELESSAQGLLDDQRWTEQPVVRARRASMAIDYASLFAAADAIASWTVPGDPPARENLPGVAFPAELEGAVKGNDLAVERIEGRWYIYGGPGPNQYDMSRIDVVIDPGGDYHYRYPRNERPRLQLVVDWAGNDQYVGENGAAGPASGLLGVSVVIDHRGNDRYEGAARSCGVGLMGIGMILDHGGNDTYQGTRWSLGAAKYGFGGIVDLGNGSDVYIAHEHSEAIGGPRGFGLILDESGNDLYRANGPIPSERGVPGIYWAFSQGVGKGDYWPDAGAYDTGGIGLLCDLAGDDRYEAGEFGQGMGYYFGLGILYDRNGRDLYYGTLSGQAAAAHGGVGLLADDGGDDTYWGAIARAQDSSLALLIDRGGNDSYQSARGVGALATALNQGIAWLIDLEGHDRYSFATSPAVRISAASNARAHLAAAAASAGLGESSANGFNYGDCQCFSLSVLLDVGGTPDFYSRADRGDGMARSTGKPNPWKPEYGNLHGLFIDTSEKMTLWP